MEIVIDRDIKLLVPGIALGVAVIEGVRVTASDSQLSQELTQTFGDLTKKFDLDMLAQEPMVRSVRNLYKTLNMDPARYRPASEALLRRVLQGKGIPAINTAVDVNNMGSLKWGIPSGIYNFHRIQPPVVLRFGKPGEEYEGLTGNRIHAADKLVLADACQVFGSPTADAKDTKVDENTTALLLVEYIPASWPQNAEAALAWSVEKIKRYNGGSVTYQQVVQ